MPRPAYWTKLEVKDDGCIEWTGSSHVNGYAKSNGIYLHRAEYERLVGPIPDDRELDHLCRNRACVNPDHLEPVTHSENVRRGDHHKRRVEQCPKGHAYDSLNTYVTPGRRHCRACRREAHRAWQERKIREASA